MMIIDIPLLYGVYFRRLFIATNYFAKWYSPLKCRYVFTKMPIAVTV